MLNGKLKVSVPLLVLLWIVSSCGGRHAYDAQLKEGFRTPPDSVKPWVYYYWINDNISSEGITKDLEAMARVGVGAALIGNIWIDGMPEGPVPVLSEEWWNLTAHTIREGRRLGVDIGLFNCPGWSQSGGPWIGPENAMRYLVSSETRVQGPGLFKGVIPKPVDQFQDVALLAFPVASYEKAEQGRSAAFIKTKPLLDNAPSMIDGNPVTACLFTRALPDNQLMIDIDLGSQKSIRSLSLFPAEAPTTASCELQVMGADGTYRAIRSFEYKRFNNRRSVGPIPNGPVSISFEAEKGRHFRIVLSDIKDGGLGEIRLSEGPVLDHYIEKQLGKMHQTPLPLWGDYLWPDQAEPDNKDMILSENDVSDLKGRLSEDGVLTWEVPDGEWTVMRIGMTPTGVTNEPTGPQGKGLEVDKAKRKDVRMHFESYIGKLLERLTLDEKQAFRYVVADSYETGSENWTDDMTEIFVDRYGYDPLPWLPVISGRIIGSADLSNRFLWDLRRLIADLISTEYVGGMREICNENQLQLWLENYGHWGFPGEFLQYGGQSDLVSGEFWAVGDLGSIELRAASSSAHIYGKPVVSAESFTAAGRPFSWHPEMLRKRGDWSFTEGINHYVVHVYIQQPYEDRIPGMNAWFGIEFNRHNTWFEYSKSWIDYTRRCMFLLQQGQSVADVCYFIGEDVPKMTGVREPALPEGYDFDYINAEVILERLEVENGKFVLPEGVSYPLMVLPPLETMRPRLLRKITDLVSAGGAVLGPAPHRSPSMANYPGCDDEIKALVEDLWGNCDGIKVKSRKFGKGVVFNGLDLSAALEHLGVAQDFKVAAGLPVLWTHRKTEEADIYFITNQGEHKINIKPGFRTSAGPPELWDAMTGSIGPLTEYEQQGHHTLVPLSMEAGSSYFVVFNSKAREVSAQGAPNFPVRQTLMQIQGPWDVTFDDRLGGPAVPVRMETLTDWVDSKDEAVRYYSGTARYSCTFSMEDIPTNRTVLLSLGNVRVIARMTLNGKDMGSLWAQPWELDVTGAIQKGENSLEIEVANLWVNKLVHDSGMPLEERLTWAAESPYSPTSPLLSSGLLGPVQLLSSE